MKSEEQNIEASAEAERMSDLFVPATASNFQERWVIVCVNPNNPDDKMEFCSVVELNAELFRLKANVHSLSKELADAQENYHLVNETVAKLIKQGKPNE